MPNNHEGSTMTAKAKTTFRAEVFDGRGIAHIWTVIEKLSGRDEYVECVGTVYGVHTQAEAMAAWRVEQERRANARTCAIWRESGGVYCGGTTGT